MSSVCQSVLSESVSTCSFHLESSAGTIYGLVLRKRWGSWGPIWGRNCLPICFTFCPVWLSDSLMGNRSARSFDASGNHDVAAKETREILLIHRGLQEGLDDSKSLVKNTVFSVRLTTGDDCKDVLFSWTPTWQSSALENTSDVTCTL